MKYPHKLSGEDGKRRFMDLALVSLVSRMEPRDQMEISHISVYFTDNTHSVLYATHDAKSQEILDQKFFSGLIERGFLKVKFCYPSQYHLENEIWNEGFINPENIPSLWNEKRQHFQHPKTADPVKSSDIICANVIVDTYRGVIFIKDEPGLLESLVQGKIKNLE